MTKPSLALVKPIDPKAIKREYKSERSRAIAIYATLFLEEHASDRDEIRTFAQEWAQFPTTANEVYEAALVAYPHNVYCRAKDRSSVTTTVSQIFNTRADLSRVGAPKKGGVWHLSPAAKRTVAPKIVPASKPTPAPVQPTPTAILNKLEKHIAQLQDQQTVLREMVLALGNPAINQVR
jgi:hypothetical protein